MISTTVESQAAILITERNGRIRVEVMKGDGLAYRLATHITGMLPEYLKSSAGPDAVFNERYEPPLAPEPPP